MRALENVVVKNTKQKYIIMFEVDVTLEAVGGNRGHEVYLDSVYKAKIPIFKDNPVRFMNLIKIIS